MSALAGIIASKRRSAATYQSTILLDSPIAYWTLNETSGTTATDSTSSPANGTVGSGVTVGYTALAAALKTCYSFNGTSNAKVTLPIASKISGIGSTITVEAWVYYPSGISHTSDIVALGGNDGFRIELYLSGGNYYLYNVFNGNGYANCTISANTLYHVVAYASPTGNGIYLNKVLSATDGTAWTGITNTANGFYIGATPVFSDYTLGQISNVAIYNKLLTTTQINNHYTVGTT